MDKTKVIVGALLLVVSSVVLLTTGFLGTPVPLLAAGLASLGLAAGSLLIGTSDTDGRPV